jgi:hypothetical protein
MEYYKYRDKKFWKLCRVGKEAETEMSSGCIGSSGPRLFGSDCADDIFRVPSPLRDIY